MCSVEGRLWYRALEVTGEQRALLNRSVHTVADDAADSSDAELESEGRLIVIDVVGPLGWHRISTIRLVAGLASLAAACLVCFALLQGQLGWNWSQMNADAPQQLAEVSDCGFSEDNIDYWTHKSLYQMDYITSAKICQVQCEGNPQCGAWTWGKTRGVAGLSDVCFLKALDRGGQPDKKEMPGVISGLPCQVAIGEVAYGDSLASTTSAAAAAGGGSLGGRGTDRVAGGSEGGAGAGDGGGSPAARPADDVDATATGGLVNGTAEQPTTTTEEPSSKEPATFSTAPEATSVPTPSPAPLETATTTTLSTVPPATTSTITSSTTSTSTTQTFTVTITSFAATTTATETQTSSTSSTSTSSTSTVSRTPTTTTTSTTTSITVTTTHKYTPGEGSLFCWSLIVPHSYEQDLLTMQHEQSISIFQCEEHAIYSNQVYEIAPGVSTFVIQSDLKCAIGGEFKTALNTDIFLAVWKRILTDGRYKVHDWTVKVDPDAVFFAERLRGILTYHPGGLDGRGVYLNNCKYGMHGPVEVFSRNAVQAWGAGIGQCLQHFSALCSGPCLWGEDMFIDQCLMRVVKVQRDDEYHVLLEDHCDPPPGWQACNDNRFASFHPFKTLDGYRLCYNSATAVPPTPPPPPPEAAQPV